MAFAVLPMLALGAGCLAALPADLAPASSVSPCRDCRRRCSAPGLGNRDATCDSSEIADRRKTSRCLELHLQIQRDDPADVGACGLAEALGNGEIRCNIGETMTVQRVDELCRSFNVYPLIDLRVLDQ